MNVPTPAARARFARQVVLVVVMLMLAGSLFALGAALRSPAAYVRANAIDFVAVYCGAAVAERADPYRVEPLRTCEQAAEPSGEANSRWAVVPAPLPPYDFLLLRPLLGLPFDMARAVWVALTFAALLVTAWCCARVTKLPAVAVLAAFLPAVGLLNAYFGEPIPLAIALIGAAALCAQTRRDAAAGVFATLALIEPHVGLGACLGAFAAFPRARRAILLTGGFLVLAGITQLGWERNLAYVAAVLPAQARAEVGANYQLSLTHLGAMAGLAAGPAVLLALWYALMLGLGILAGRSFARCRSAPAAAVYVPVTFTMFGGSYMHVPEIAAAIPGVLLLCVLLSGAARAFAVVALALLVVPWDPGSGNGMVAAVPLSLAAVFVASAMSRAGNPAPLSFAALMTLAVGAYIALLPAANVAVAAVAAVPPAIGPGDLASDDWALYVAANPQLGVEDGRHLLMKIPAWLGLLIAICAALVRRPRAAHTTRPPVHE